MPILQTEKVVIFNENTGLYLGKADYVLVGDLSDARFFPANFIPAFISPIYLYNWSEGIYFAIGYNEVPERTLIRPITVKMTLEF